MQGLELGLSTRADALSRRRHVAAPPDWAAATVTGGDRRLGLGTERRAAPRLRDCSRRRSAAQVPSHSRCSAARLRHCSGAVPAPYKAHKAKQL